MITLLGVVLVTMTMVMTAGWVCQRAANDGGWTDVFWTFGTGAVCASAALIPFGVNASPTWRQELVACLVAAWSIRLGTYIFVRVARGPEDARYAGFRREWGSEFQRRMFGVLIVQAPATALLSVSVLLAAHNPDPHFRLRDLFGAAIFIAAVFGEAIADRQMKRFKSDPANHGQVCADGLWSWSRHPNYFFEFLGWLAYPVIAIDAARPWTWAALTAPAVMFVILRFGTGLPPLESAMVRSKGDAYRAYQARVSPFLPRPPRQKLKREVTA